MTLQNEIEDIAEAKVSADLSKQKEDEARVRLRQGIIDGVRTESPIVDYLLFLYGEVPEFELERYSAVNNMLKGNSGKLVMVSRTVEVPSPRMHAPSQSTSLSYVGLLKSDQLVPEFTTVNKRPVLFVPTGKYADQANKFSVIPGMLPEIQPDYNRSYDRREPQDLFQAEAFSLDQTEIRAFLWSYLPHPRNEDWERVRDKFIESLSS